MSTKNPAKRHNRNNLGHPLLIARGVAGLSQTELAKQSGVSVTTINHIEALRIKRPNNHTIMRLSLALKIDAMELGRDIDDWAAENGL